MFPTKIIIVYRNDCGITCAFQFCRIASGFRIPIRIAIGTLNSRVSKGISAQASHRTVLETLASHGSCYLVRILLRSSSDKRVLVVLFVSFSSFSRHPFYTTYICSVSISSVDNLHTLKLFSLCSSQSLRSN